MAQGHGEPARRAQQQHLERALGYAVPTFIRSPQEITAIAGLALATEKLDLSLLVSDAPCVAAGVFTQNLVFAAPVKLKRRAAASKALSQASGGKLSCFSDIKIARSSYRKSLFALGHTYKHAWRSPEGAWQWRT